MTLINRARRRRRYLDDRRRVAGRIYAREAEVEEMKSRLAMPSGHRLVGRWQEARDQEAATKVQNMWRSVRSKKKLVVLIEEQQRQEAARKLQSFARRRRQGLRQGLLAKTAQENPCWRPADLDRIMEHEKAIVNKRRQWHSSMQRGLNEAELKQQADERYRELLQGAGRWRYDVWRLLLQREQTRQCIQALEGRSWDRPLPYGVCSAALLQEAEEKHRARKAAMLQEQKELGGVHIALSGEVPYVESRTEELEADALLQSLESDLGFDFSMAGDKPADL